MNKHLGVLLAALLPAVFWATGAVAQVCPAGSTCNSLESYFYGQTPATQPYGSGLRIPVMPSAAASSAQYIAGNLLATLTDTQTLTNKTVNCANNTCTVRLASDVIGNLPLANLATQADGTVVANISGGAAVPSASTLSAVIDHDIGSTQGGILYRSGAVWSYLAPGTTGQFLQTQGASANPLWATASGSGSVTNVGLTVPAWLSVAGSPITTSGTLAITGSSQSANLFLASPNGSAGAVSPRAIIAADLPAIPTTALTGALAAANFPALTGDVTTPAGSLATTLANTAVTPGTYQGITVNSKGLVTTGAAMNGDATMSGSALTLANTAVTPGSYTSANITVDGKGRLTAAANGSGGAGVSGPGSSVNTDLATWNGTGGNTLADSGLALVNVATNANTLTLSNKTISGASNTLSNIPTTALTGTLQTAQEPAHTGDVTNSAGLLAMTVAANAVTNAKAAQMTANTIKGNFTGITANAADNAVPSCADSAGNHLNYTSGGGLSCGTSSSGGGTAVLFVGNTAGAANAYTIASPTPGGFTLTDQNMVCGTVSATNTGASTLAVNGTAATAIKRQTAAGLGALVGGELVANNTQYCFQYNAAGSAYVMTTNLATGVTNAATSTTITAAQWANGQVFIITTAGQTLTLPVSTGLAPNGGIIVGTVGNSVTVQPNAADAVNGGTAGAAVTIMPGKLTSITSDGAGNIYVPVGGIDSVVPLTDAATIAVNASQGNIFTVTLGGNRALGNPTNIRTGQTLTFVVTQDGTGSRTLTYNSDFKWPGGTAPVLTTTAAAIDMFTCLANSTSTLLCTPAQLNIH